MQLMEAQQAQLGPVGTKILQKQSRELVPPARLDRRHPLPPPVTWGRYLLFVFALSP